MIGLVLVTHGRLADEFVAALEHVVGPQENVRTVCMFPDDDIEETHVMLRDAGIAIFDADGNFIELLERRPHHG